MYEVSGESTAFLKCFDLSLLILLRTTLTYIRQLILHQFSCHNIPCLLTATILYTVSQKRPTLSFAVTLTNIDRFFQNSLLVHSVQNLQ